MNKSCFLQIIDKRAYQIFLSMAIARASVSFFVTKICIFYLKCITSRPKYIFEPTVIKGKL